MFPRRARLPEPPLSPDLDPDQLDRGVRAELSTLSGENAGTVARHLLAAEVALHDDDLDLALAHTEVASRKAGRVAAVREALGLVRYRRGEWAQALAEFRTARRLSGSDHLLPYLADVERGLGRPERALQVATSAAARQLGAAEQAELAIVVAGARRDLGQLEAALTALRDLVRVTRSHRPWAARVYYAYADALAESGELATASQWFDRARRADVADDTDAAVRVEDPGGDREVPQHDGGVDFYEVAEEGQAPTPTPRESRTTRPARPRS